MVRSGRWVAALGAAALLAVACGSGSPSPGSSPRPPLTASPLSPPPAPSPSPSPTPEETPSPAESPSPTPRDPTDTDRARAVAAYQPEDATDLEHVAVDVDGDGIEELVFVYVRASAQVVRVEVAWWTGTEYAVGWGDDGGPADRIDEVRVADINADGRTEIVVSHSIGASGASVTLWRVATDARRFDPLIAVGGCHDGSNTYGVIGAEVVDRDGDGRAEIEATCDDSPLPTSAWSTDVYVWRDGAYRYDHTRFPGT